GLVGGGLGALAVGRRDEDRRELRERRIEERAAEFELGASEAVRVVGRRAADRGVLRVERLDVDGAARLPAARSAGDLREQLERLLGGAEVREVQQRVGGEDADRGDAREVVAL